MRGTKAGRKRGEGAYSGTVVLAGRIATKPKNDVGEFAEQTDEGDDSRTGERRRIVDACRMG